MKNTRESNHEISISDWRRKPTILLLSGICKKSVVCLSIMALSRLILASPLISVFFLTRKNDFNDYLTNTNMYIIYILQCPHHTLDSANVKAMIFLSILFPHKFEHILCFVLLR